MAAPRDLIRVCQHDQSLTLLVQGWGTMTQGYAIRTLAEHCFQQGTKTIRFDLRRCTYMDSTFLGTLLSLRRRVDRCGEGTLQLVSPSPECRQLLQKMSMEGLFNIVEEDEAVVDSHPLEVPGVPVNPDTLRHNVVDVHRELAKLPGPAGEPFRIMIQGVDRELQAQASGQADKP